MISMCESVDLLKEQRHNILYLLYYFILYAIVYGYMCLREGLAVEEALYFREYYGVLLSNGRWGIQLFRYLTDTCNYLPYAAGILGGIFISGAIFTQISILEIKSATGKFIYAGMYMGCVQWTYQLRYSNQSHAVALGLLLASLAIYLLIKTRGWRTLILASFLLCFAISTYQTVGGYAMVLMVAAMLQRNLSDASADIIAPTAKAAAGFMFAILLYYCIHKTANALIDVPQNTQRFVQEYQNNMIGWKEIVKHGQGGIIHHFILRAIKSPIYNITGQNYPGQWVMTSALVPAVLLIVHSLRKYSLFRTCINSLLIFAIFYLPFSADLLLGYGIGVRSQLADALPAATIWSISFSRLSWCKFRIVQWSVVFLTLYVCIFASCKVAEIARDEQWSLNRGKDELIIMYVRGQQLALDSGMEDCRIVLLGSPRPLPDHMYKVKQTGFMEDEALPDLLRAPDWATRYARFFRLPRLQGGTPEDMEKHLEAFQRMPIWPVDGSVRVNKDEVIIKIGPLSK